MPRQTRRKSEIREPREPSPWLPPWLLNDRSKIIGIAEDCILTPNEPYEIKGRVDNVVFPCGAIADQETDTIRIYYGGADTCIGLATGSLSELIDACKKGFTYSKKK